MAVSGSQKTRIGLGQAVAIAITIVAKSPSTPTEQGAAIRFQAGLSERVSAVVDVDQRTQAVYQAGQRVQFDADVLKGGG